MMINFQFFSGRLYFSSSSIDSSSDISGSDSGSSSSDIPFDDSSSDTGSVSSVGTRLIMTTPIDDYTVTEGYLLIAVFFLVVLVFIKIFKR